MSVLASSSSLADQPGTLGFLVVFGMAVVLFFLFRSMSKHLRKVSGSAGPGAGPAGPGAGPAGLGGHAQASAAADDPGNEGLSAREDR